MELTTFIHASAHHLPQLADGSVQMIATSPPYYGLRAYAGEQGVEWPEVTFRLNEWVEASVVPPMRCGLGMEPTPVAFIGHLILCLREWRRVLRDDGTCFVNLGDSYAGSNALTTNEKALAGKQGTNRGTIGTLPRRVENNGVKPKDLLGIPWLFAIAARADGWYLRSDIIWCLSGGTVVYAKTQKGVMPMTIKDMARLDPATVQLWNGQQWTQLLGMSKSARKGDELELVLRSGERISCTPTHRFPTQRGIVEAGALNTGDVITRTQLPEPTQVKDGAHIGTDAAWLAGLYLAEGSRAGDTIQLAGHASQLERLERVQRIAAAYGGSVTCTVDGNTQSIRVYGKVLNALIDELVTGSTAKDKGFAPVVWRYSNAFVSAMLDGYLSGDGHWDALNKRWRLGFTRNYNLERDLRTACARLGYQLTLKPAHTPYNGKQVATFRGEIRMERSGHHNECDMGEVVEIRKARCREVYDLGVADEPHLFALASGVLTHNSKPNPMPESVTDRPTKAHEYVFLLAKSQRYFWDAEGVKESGQGGWNNGGFRNGGEGKYIHDSTFNNSTTPQRIRADEQTEPSSTRNLRTVWTIATQPTPFAHFATFPEKLVEPMIRAGSSERGACPHCGKAWVRVVERTQYEPEVVAAGVRFVDESRGDKVRKLSGKDYNASVCVLGETWQPACTCPAHEPVPCVVLDPFNGSGTTAKVAVRLGRAYVGVDISQEYLDGVTSERFGAGVQIGFGL